MKAITALSVVTILLLDAIGPRSSVGGPLAGLFLSLLMAWAVGIYMAWSKHFRPAGWALSIVAAMVGGFVGLMIVSMAMDKILSVVHFQGRRLIDSNWSLVTSAAGALLTVLGVWGSIEFGSRLFARRSAHEA